MNGEWHVVISRFGLAIRAAESISSLSCVSEVYAPVRTWVARSFGRDIVCSSPWLGSFVLARWPRDDPQAWHCVADAVDLKRPLTSVVSGILGGWPPSVVSDLAVKRFADAIQAIENKGQGIDLPPPCAPGDAVRFTHLGGAFYNVLGYCLWVAAGVVGVRLRILGRDQVIQVPYEDVALARGLVARQYGRRRAA